MDDDKMLCFVIIIVIILAVSLGVLVQKQNSDKKWEKDAIKQGYAEYNQITGRWQWKQLDNMKDSN